MGTMLQAYRFGEADFRGDRFRDHPRDLRGNSDLLCLTQPDAVAAVHAGYLGAGADIITTNSFTATRIAQADYGLDPATVRELNVAAARVARDASDAAERAEPDRPRFVAGSLGPTNRTASMSADVSDPAARSVTWDELVTAYRESAAGLVEGGADLLLIETIFDTLNAKAAIFAVQSLFDELGDAPAADDLGDDRRRVGTNAVRPDRRGVLVQRPPCRSADRRAQLRARSAAAPRASRRPLGDRRPAGLGLPQCRPAERARRLRRDAPRRWPARSGSGPATGC